MPFSRRELLKIGLASLGAGLIPADAHTFLETPLTHGGAVVRDILITPVHRRGLPVGVWTPFDPEPPDEAATPGPFTINFNRLDGTVLITVMLHPHSSYRWVAAPGHEIQLARDDRLRVVTDPPDAPFDVTYAGTTQDGRLFGVCDDLWSWLEVDGG